MFSNILGLVDRRILVDRFNHQPLNLFKGKFVQIESLDMAEVKVKIDPSQTGFVDIYSNSHYMGRYQMSSNGELYILLHQFPRDAENTLFEGSVPIEYHINAICRFLLLILAIIFKPINIYAY